MAGLALRVQPGARRTRLVGWMADGTLKLSVSEPPEDGRANRAVVELLAAMLGVREIVVRVVRGHGARTKRVEVDGMDEQTLRRRLTGALEPRGKPAGEPREPGVHTAGGRKRRPREEGGKHDGR